MTGTTTRATRVEEESEKKKVSASWVDPAAEGKVLKKKRTEFKKKRRTERVQKTAQKEFVRKRGGDQELISKITVGR